MNLVQRGEGVTYSSPPDARKGKSGLVTQSCDSVQTKTTGKTTKNLLRREEAAGTMEEREESSAEYSHVPYDISDGGPVKLWS